MTDEAKKADLIAKYADLDAMRLELVADQANSYSDSRAVVLSVVTTALERIGVALQFLDYLIAETTP